MTKLLSRLFYGLIAAASPALITLKLHAAETTDLVVESNPFLSGVMVIVVFATAAGSAVLPIAAIRYWPGYWKLVAAAPIALLLVWSGWITLAKWISPETHSYWPLEIFTWSMLTMIYMVTVMTAKRVFEKADKQVH